MSKQGKRPIYNGLGLKDHQTPWGGEISRVKGPATVVPAFVCVCQNSRGGIFNIQLTKS
jgi:hypothetical protein